MQDPYNHIHSLPGHVLAARSVAQLEPMTFLENLEVDGHGNIIMTSILDGRLWRLPFGGVPQLMAQLPGRGYSVAAAPDNGWLVFGTRLGAGVAVFQVFEDGSHSLCMDLPDAIFPNGVQRFPKGHYLLADSVTATIWDIDYHARRVTPWYQHASLAPAPGSWLPALNGMKVFGDKLYMSNSSTAQILALKLLGAHPSGEPEVIAHDVSGDDFAFDTEGSMYITTHPLDAVLKLSPDGALTKVAGPEQGVRGCTACRFGRAPGDETGLYVVTDGGLFNPMSGGLKPAQVIRLETGVTGAPVDFN